MRFDERKTAEYAAKREAQKQRRIEAWAWLNKEAPEAVDFLVRMNAAFGKPAVLVISQTSTGRVWYDSRLIK